MSRQRTARDTDINTFMGTEMNPYLVNMPTKMFGNIFGHREKNGYNPKDMANSQKKLEDAAQKALVVVDKGKVLAEQQMKKDKLKFQASQAKHTELENKSNQYKAVLIHVNPERNDNVEGDEDEEDGN